MLKHEFHAKYPIQSSSVFCSLNRFRKLKIRESVAIYS